MARKKTTREIVALLRERLLTEQARLTVEYRQHLGEAVELTSVDFDDTPVDVAAEQYEWDRSKHAAASYEAVLRKIKRALEKMEEGTYGLCEDCEKPIAPARLEALPYVERCVDCQNMAELFE